MNEHSWEESEWEESDTIEEFRAQIPNHPPTNECPDMECCICAMRDCPGEEPLHYHHDGCPYCYQQEQENRGGGY